MPTNGSPRSGPATARRSRSTLPDLAAMATAAELEQSIANQRHAMAMAEANLRRHYGEDWQEPDDVAISWNSPTTTHYHGGGLGRLGGPILAALGGGAAALGVAAVLGAFATSGPGPAAPPDGTEWDITIETVDGKPTATEVEVVK